MSSSNTSNRSPNTKKSQHEPSVAGSVLTVSTSTGSQGSDNVYIRIQNMTATANLGVKLDLKQIALRCRNTEFNPKRFAAVIMRLLEPKATGLIFASGKLVVTGLRSSHNAALVAKKFAYIIEKVGFKPQFLDFKVQNIVGTVDVGFPIRLEGLAYKHSQFASYEPELFSGLIYRLGRPKVVLMIFVSGKVIITGAKTEADMGTAMSKIHPVLVEFRKGTIQAPFGKGGAPIQDAAAITGDAQAPPLALANNAANQDDGDNGGVDGRDMEEV